MGGGWVVVTNLGVVRGNPDRVQSEVRGGFVAQSPETLIYDADGNLVRDGRWVYSWDAENRPVRVMSYGASDRAGWGRVDWAYDALGRRIRQTSYVLSNGVWVVTEDLKFVSDPVWFGRHVAELNATNHALLRSYVWGLDPSETLDGAGGVGGLLWVRMASGPASGAHFVTCDGNGNVWQLVSATTGMETARYEYGPFGEPLRTTGPAASSHPFRFSTKRTDAHSGLVLYEYRTYNAGLGRWLNRDPVREWGGLNLYGYAENSPVKRYDLLGLTIPGLCAEAYPPYCPCKCISVTVTFSPGNDQFEWGWVINLDGSLRFGNNMRVVWKVQGPASRCKYVQRETGAFRWYNLSKPTQPPKDAMWSASHEVADSHGTCRWGRREYTDSIGATFISPADDGYWISAVVTPPSITLECVSSDGTKLVHQLEVPPPPDPGRFPPL